MCDDGYEDDDNTVGEHHEEGGLLATATGRPTRRLLLGGAVAAVGAPVLGRTGSAAAATRNVVTGQRSFLAAMHLHGSFSERQGSWQGQASRMVEESMDLMFMTDHSYLLMASHMAADLTGVHVVTTTTGSLARSRSARTSTGGFSLLAESANRSPASAGLSIDPQSLRTHRAIRTSVMGQTWRHTFGQVNLAPGALYEIRISMSHHPATAGRPAGVYELCYRFGPGLPVSRASESRGLSQVFVRPLPPSGTAVDLDIAGDTATAWPDLVAEDNSTQYASFVVTSPAAGKAAAVEVTSLSFQRAARTPASVAQVQQHMADVYSARYGVSIHPGVELGDQAHHNAFLDHQYFAPDEELGFSDPDTYTRRNVDAVHAMGGVISWNHPYGVDTGTPLTGLAADRRRRAVFQKLAASDLYGADILEVGYAVRGGMSIEAHMDLWDTFSRHGRFLTANGVSDSHDTALSGLTRANEFATGIWSGSAAMTDILPALLAGRAYTRHAGAWPGGALDLVVDDTHLMGQVVVDGRTRHQLTITATNLPSGSVVEIVGSPVDYTGVDPATTVVDRLPASSLGRTGVASYALTTGGSAFVRLTIRDELGSVIGLSNPVWLLRSSPPGGVPIPRRSSSGLQ